MGTILIIVLLGTAPVWIGGIYFALRKGLNEIINGLNSIDGRLARIEATRPGGQTERPSN